MKLNALLDGVSHEIIQNGGQPEISSITIDSRVVKPGTLFICIRGLTVDGHDYIAAAVNLGAAAILVESDDNDYPPGVFVIRVDNTRLAMAYIAANFYGNPAKKLRLVGATGTNGKTTVTCFIEEILRSCGRSTGLIGTVGAKVNNKVMDFSFATSTTPDPLELHAILAKMVEMGVQDVVMEVSSHALALHKMEGLVFDVGVFTNLTQDHLDFHGNMDNYRLAKAQLFAQSRFGVVNIDDDSTPTMVKFLCATNDGEPYLTYGIKKQANLQAVHIKLDSHGATFDVASYRFTLPINGRFNVYNALAAIGTAKVLGIEMTEIREAVAKLTGVPGRIQSVPNHHGVHVLVDYAHSPDGLANIIPAVRDFTAGQVITLFGCGGDRDRTKRPIMGEIAGELSDYCILTSDNPRTENPQDILKEIELGIKQTNTPYEICENRKDAISKGVEMLKPGDALIIAGKGHEDYQIIGTTKHYFSDYETAVDILNTMKN